MTAAQREQLRRSLQSLEAELLGKGQRKIIPNRTSEEEVGGDEDEQPLNEMLQTIASDRNRTSAATLALVQKALEKLRREPEAFGECEECGDEIPLGRLKAMPYAELCVSCQSKRDGPRSLPTRKKLTDFR
jgi:DnaK suppressor protein